MQSDGAMKVPALVVDRLPLRLWEPANLYLGARLHFCVAASAEGDWTVRTVEWNGEEVGRGHASLDVSSIPDPHGYGQH
jgi:hypothetical protein